MSDENLSQVINISTRGRNTLDLLFTDHPALINHVQSAPGFSDHDTLIIEHQIKATINKKPPRKVYQYKKADWEGMQRHIRAFAVDHDVSSMTVEENWVCFKSMVHAAMDKFIPSKILSTRFNLPYLSQSTKRKMRRRRRAHKRAKKYNRDEDWSQCKTLRKEINKEL